MFMTITVCVLVGVLLLTCVVLPLVQYIRRTLAPVRQAPARVLVAQEQATTIAPGWLMSALLTSRYTRFFFDDWQTRQYMVTFELGAPDYERLDFLVRESNFYQYQPDDTGLLVYKGDKLLKFTPLGPMSGNAT